MDACLAPSSGAAVLRHGTARGPAAAPVTQPGCMASQVSTAQPGTHVYVAAHVAFDQGEGRAELLCMRHPAARGVS